MLRAVRPSLFGSAIAVAALAALALAPAAAGSPSLLLLSTDPFTNSTSQHKTEVEPDSLSFGSTIVSAFQVGRFFNGGSTDIGFATSTDNGATWVHGFLPGTTVNSNPAGTYQRTSDPTVAFDPRHNVWLISYLGIVNPTGPVDVVVSRSTNGGLTWGNPVVINASGDFNDKNWTTCDTTPTSPFYGNCYTEFDDNTQRDLVLMSTSTDGGLTWGAAQTTTGKLNGIGGQPLVQPNGQVIVPINGFAGQNFLMLAFTSTDGGATWGHQSFVAKVFFHHAAGGIRDSIPLPSAEIDATGTVYVSWQDCRFETGCAASDLVLSSSSDGQHWSKVTRVPLDPVGSGVDHFIPGLGVDRSTGGSSAHLALDFYYYTNTSCTTATCELHVGTSVSADGGATWTARNDASGPMSLGWLPNTSQGFMVGDYLSTSFAAGQAFPIFEKANAPSGTVFDEATYTIAGGLSAASALAASDHASNGVSPTLTTSSVTSQ